MKLNNRILLIYILLLPLLVNLIVNIFQEKYYFGLQNSSGNMELINLLLSFFLFVLYFFIGKVVKNILNTKFISTSIVIFWISLFSIDNFLVLFFKNIDFKYFLTVMLLILIGFSLFKKENLRPLILILITYFFIQLFMYFINIYPENLSLSQDLLYTSDERELWYPALKNIFEENYYSVLTNNPYPGYGLLTSHVASVNTFLLIGFKSFNYYLAINYLTIYLFFLFLYEIIKNKTVFVFMFILFSTIILSSHWFTYVFFGSLLSEGVSSFCFGVLLTEAFLRKKHTQPKFTIILVYISIGFLFYTRQFISTIVLIFLAYQIFKKREKILLIGFLPFFLKTFQSIVLPNTYIDPYITNEELSKIIFNLNNLYKMILQFFIDKPVTYLFIILTILIISNIKLQKEYFDFYIFFILNLSMVSFLMIFLWEKDDVQSSYRYILNSFYLILYPMSDMLSKNFLKNK